MSVTIGKTYVLSIGRTYSPFPHALPMLDDEKKTLWDRVVEVLKEHGIQSDQQTHVAGLIKIKQPSVWEWKDGGEPSMKNAKALALKLNVSVEWLLTGRGEKRPIPPDPDAMELWDMWNGLDAAKREKILSFARFVKSEPAGPFQGSGKPLPEDKRRHG